MEAIVTILGIFGFIYAFVWIINTMGDIIGKEVYKLQMKSKWEADEIAYKASFDAYMASLKESPMSAEKQGVTGWISRQQYQEYLESAEWRSKADHRLAIDGYRCQYCDSEVKSRINDRHKPNIHHFHYRDIMHENVYDDLITLCKVCHTNLHRDYSIKDMEVEIKTHGFAYK